MAPQAPEAPLMSREPATPISSRRLLLLESAARTQFDRVRRCNGKRVKLQEGNSRPMGTSPPAWPPCTAARPPQFAAGSKGHTLLRTTGALARAGGCLRRKKADAPAAAPVKQGAPPCGAGKLAARGGRTHARGTMHLIAPWHRRQSGTAALLQANAFPEGRNLPVPRRGRACQRQAADGRRAAAKRTSVRLSCGSEGKGPACVPVTAALADVLSG